MVGKWICESVLLQQCADKDLLKRLTGLKQHPGTGQLYNKDQWKHEDLVDKKKDKDDDEEEEQGEQVGLMQVGSTIPSMMSLFDIDITALK